MLKHTLILCSFTFLATFGAFSDEGQESETNPEHALFSCSCKKEKKSDSYLVNSIPVGTEEIIDAISDVDLVACECEVGDEEANA